jgi:hypothetical protein
VATGATSEPHDSLYLGEYDLLPEVARVKYNFVAGIGDWNYTEEREYAVHIVAEETERPEDFRALAAGLSYESRVLKEEPWRPA